MATSSQTMPQTTPQTSPTKHTYVLCLRPDANKAAPPHVEIQDGDSYWMGVKPGDLVQFVPDPSTPTASVEVSFEPMDGKLPLDVSMVTSTDFFPVTCDTLAFKTWCFLHVDGVRYGYEGVDGRPCPNGC